VGTADIPTEACVTHLDNDPAEQSNDAQLNGAQKGGTHSGLLRSPATEWQGAAAWAEDHANGYPLVFGGDFNLNPTQSAMQPPYHGIEEYGDASNPTTQYFSEIDPANHPTDGNTKIDYLFFKHGYAQNPQLAAGSPKFFDTVHVSDHAMLYGYIDLCSTSGCTG
jgi:endonuclease/exonuclease/phosphatase family metal-dependent hydrolase